MQREVASSRVSAPVRAVAASSARRPAVPPSCGARADSSFLQCLLKCYEVRGASAVGRWSPDWWRYLEIVVATLEASHGQHPI